MGHQPREQNPQAASGPARQTTDFDRAFDKSLPSTRLASGSSKPYYAGHGWVRFLGRNQSPRTGV